MQRTIKEPVAILGYGIEGHAAYAFCKELGLSDITICDQNETVNLPGDCHAKKGEDAFKDLAGFACIFRSPGVHYDLPALAEAVEAGTMVTSMTELTMEAAEGRITAITGSNGKTSVVGMLETILAGHYKRHIVVGGNDRKPVLTEVTTHPNWPVLLEVSSFQFADLKRSPHIAAILNITPNHLDWHENLEDYIHAKKNLVAHQTPNDWAVLNASDENSKRLAQHSPGEIFWLNHKEGKAWAIWEDGNLVAQFGTEPQVILNEKDLIIKTHPDNLLCVAAVSLLHEVSPATIKKCLSDFVGVEHRMEFIRELGGVKFYNDSACTTPESARVAIELMPPGQLILLLGGSSKKADFSFLAHHIVHSKTRVCLYGQESPRIRDAVSDCGGEHLIIGFDDSGDFSKIIATAAEAAQKGDCVVLSPACASFDMFKNSKDRGKQFKEIVNNLAPADHA